MDQTTIVFIFKVLFFGAVGGLVAYLIDRRKERKRREREMPETWSPPKTPRDPADIPKDYSDRRQIP